MLKTSYSYRFHPFYLSFSPGCDLNARECFDGPAASQQGMLGALIVWWPASFWLQWTMAEGTVHTGSPAKFPTKPTEEWKKFRKMYAIKQIKICAEYRDMLPRPRLDLSGTPWPVFYLISWSPSHLKFFLQVTWPFSIFTPSDLVGKSLGEIPSDLSSWLGDILGRSNIVICILYLFKSIYVTLYDMFTTYLQKAVRNLFILN